MSIASSNLIYTVTKKETRPMIALWVVLFALTIAFSGDLSLRSLAAAFTAWLGGIVTAEIMKTYDIIERLWKSGNNDQHTR